ncbi:Hypothetical protein, putative [Bodo saltans]|uniref:Uncharacterized protein n=1 Tax=Bodo saltans TaxID=75058 RepID=A0A0S4JFF8_BODSA|nr:Hypothetical protein, putative [Bodo saltans]|eukprot:CUG90231.1 Hypothetical protein, putative [Bodo saltans]
MPSFATVAASLSDAEIELLTEENEMMLCELLHLRQMHADLIDKERRLKAKSELLKAKRNSLAL